MHISNWARTPMQTKQFSIAFPSSSVLSVLAVTREIDHESMRQFYLNFRHIFRCNLRESWRANTVRPKSICIRNSIQFLFLIWRSFFLNWAVSVLYQFCIQFSLQCQRILESMKCHTLHCTVKAEPILIHNFKSGKVHTF